MNDKQINIIVKVIDNASKQIKNIQKNVSKFSFDISDFSRLGLRKFSVLGAEIMKFGKIAAATAGVVGTALFVIAKQAAEAADVQMFFNRTFAVNGVTAIEKFREATLGTIPDMKLMQIANKSALLGVSASVEELGGLMITARLRGQAMGIGMEQAFNDIVTGIGRGSPLILDNLGIKIPEALKESMEKMSDTAKTQALLNFAIEDGAVLAEQLGGITVTNAERFAQLTTKITNLKQEIGERVAPVILNFFDRIQALYLRIKENLQPQIEELRKSIEKLRGKLMDNIPTWEQTADKVVIFVGALISLTTNMIDFINKHPTLVKSLTAITIALGATAVAIWAVNSAAGVLLGILAVIGLPLTLLITLIALVIANWDQLVVTWEWVKDRASNATQILKDNIGAALDWIWQKVKNVMNDVIYWINEGINRLNNLLSRLSQNKAIKLIIGDAQIPNIPYLAEGGIVSKPTLAVVGEAGPEAVVPLSGNNTPRIGTEPHLHIHIENFFGGETEKNKLATDIWRRINLLAKARGQNVNDMFKYI